MIDKKIDEIKKEIIGTYKDYEAERIGKIETKHHILDLVAKWVVLEDLKDEEGDN